MVSWNVYRDQRADPSPWGAPRAADVADADPIAPGIQHVDAGAVDGLHIHHYLITAQNGCGESPLR